MNHIHVSAKVPIKRYSNEKGERNENEVAYVDVYGFIIFGNGDGSKLLGCGSKLGNCSNQTYDAVSATFCIHGRKP